MDSLSDLAPHFPFPDFQIDLSHIDVNSYIDDPALMLQNYPTYAEDELVNPLDTQEVGYPTLRTNECWPRGSDTPDILHSITQEIDGNSVPDTMYDCDGTSLITPVYSMPSSCLTPESEDYCHSQSFFQHQPGFESHLQTPEQHFHKAPTTYSLSSPTLRKILPRPTALYSTTFHQTESSSLSLNSTHSSTSKSRLNKLPKSPAHPSYVSFYCKIFFSI